MAVRFVPSEEESHEDGVQRENLAEVIELRTLLTRASDIATPSGAEEPAPAPEPEPESEPELQPVAEAATRLLARRALSTGELRAALRSRGYSEIETEDVLADFEQSLYLDDAALATAVTEKLRGAKKASRSQIRVKLRERKLSDAAIEYALAQLSEDEEAELLRAAAEDRARRLRGLEPHTAKRRLLGYLQRRGWQGEATYRIVDEVLSPSS